jgi:DNA replication and repair protein RecF
VRVDRFESANFRNLAGGAVEFGPALNVLIGENGQGKTNLLEAIYYFRFGHSFRAGGDGELIEFHQPFCRFEAGTTFSDGRSERFACSIERRDGSEQVTRTIKVDGQVLRRRADLAGRFPVVLFGPQDLRIVSGEPEQRRRFVDMVGTTTYPAYLRAATDYRRVLEQRNAALKARADRAEMAAWNERLVGPGTELTVRRWHLTAWLESLLIRETGLMGRPFDFFMSYESSLVDAILPVGPPPEDPDQHRELVEGRMRDAFHAQLEARAAEEARRGITLVGPHRDDIRCRLDRNDLRKFGSQGQRRLFAVLLKLSELAHLEHEMKEPCVLLLDDVFSEFDPVITQRLHRVFQGGRQVFVTTPVELPPDPSLHTHTLRVDAGRITPR